MWKPITCSSPSALGVDGLERPGARDVHRVQPVAVAEQAVAGRTGRRRLTITSSRDKVRRRDAGRQAQLPQRTLRTAAT